tara:strand:+ start:8701 stop:9372 length:672 start_codon:yes stop_codon:yes gene_type:complete
MEQDLTPLARFYYDYIKPWHESDKTIGVIMSGGFDSAVLWHMVYEQCLKHKVKIKAFTVPKPDGSILYANRVLEESCKYFGTKRIHTIPVGPVDKSNREPDDETLVFWLNKGIREAYIEQGADVMFLGTNPFADDILEWSDELPKGRVFATGTIYEDIIKMPFEKLTKEWLVRIAYEEGRLEALSEITHTCTMQPRGRCGECFWCKERDWAFSKAGYKDIGKE